MGSPFDHCAGDYAAARPPYPEALLDALDDYVKKSPQGQLLPADVRGVDLGAGTGIFTRHLARRGWSGVAFDIGMALLAELVRDSAAEATGGNWSAVCSKAETLPLADESIDLVTAAQSFHWFNPKLAFVEIARFLKPGGVLALVWNNRDVEACPFWQDYEDLIERFNPAYEREYRRQDWSTKAEQSGAFLPMTHRQFRWDWTISREQLLGYARSISYIRNVLSADRMAEFLDELGRLWERQLKSNLSALSMMTDLYLTRRKPN